MFYIGAQKLIEVKPTFNMVVEVLVPCTSTSICSNDQSCFLSLCRSRPNPKLHVIKSIFPTAYNCSKNIHRNLLFCSLVPHHNTSTSTLHTDTIARSKHLGSGACCSVLMNKIHPGTIVAAKFPTPGYSKWLKDLIITYEDEVVCNRKCVESCFVC